MAKIIVVNNVAPGQDKLTSILLHDIDKVQSLREHTINPPGQERYLKPVDEKVLDAKLRALGADAAVTPATVLAATVEISDVSIAAIRNAVGQVGSPLADLTGQQAQEIQDILCVSLIETGKVLLSIDRGVLAKTVELGWVEVLQDDGVTPF